MSKRFITDDKNFIEVIKGGSITFFFYGLNLVLVYLIATFISKNYGAEVYGRYSIVKSLILVLIIFATLGLNTLSIRLSSSIDFFEQGLYKNDYLRKSYIIVLSCTFLISSVIYFGAEALAETIFKDAILLQYFRVFPVLFVAAVVLNYNSNTFKGQGKVLLFAVTSSFLTNFLFFFSLLISFYFFSKTEITLIRLLLVSFLLTLIVSIRYTFPIRFASEFNRISIKTLLRKSLPMMVSSSMIFVIFSIDILMLGYFETSKNVGIYKIIVQIASLNTVFVIVFSTVIGPKISKFFSEGNRKELNTILYRTLKTIFFLTAPILLLILFFLTPILSFFGEEYIIAKKPLVILAISQFLFAITGFVDLTLNMTGKQKIFGKITIVTAIINLILNYLLIPKLGITGAATATGVSILLTNVLGVIYITKKLRLQSIYIPGLKKI